jgi:hypothetical protein
LLQLERITFTIILNKKNKVYSNGDERRWGFVNIYETIILILDKKGPLSIPLICQEVNEMLVKNQSDPILPSHIKSIVTRKKDLFRVREGNISIAPDKNPYSITVILEGDEGISYQLNVDFIKKRFSFFEWRNKRHQKSSQTPPTRRLGNIDEFKRELMALKIWEWQSYYGAEVGITLGKTNWTVKLKTTSKTHVFEGTDCYPEKWAEFCQSIEKLAGVSFTI